MKRLKATDIIHQKDLGQNIVHQKYLGQNIIHQIYLGQNIVHQKIFGSKHCPLNKRFIATSIMNHKEDDGTLRQLRQGEILAPLHHPSGDPFETWEIIVLKMMTTVQISFRPAHNIRLNPFYDYNHCGCPYSLYDK